MARSAARRCAADIPNVSHSSAVAWPTAHARHQPAIRSNRASRSVREQLRIADLVNAAVLWDDGGTHAQRARPTGPPRRHRRPRCVPHPTAPAPTRSPCPWTSARRRRGNCRRDHRPSVAIEGARPGRVSGQLDTRRRSRPSSLPRTRRRSLADHWSRHLCLGGDDEPRPLLDFTSSWPGDHPAYPVNTTKWPGIGDHRVTGSDQPVPTQRRPDEPRPRRRGAAARRSGKDRWPSLLDWPAHENPAGSTRSGAQSGRTRGRAPPRAG